MLPSRVSLAKSVCSSDVHNPTVYIKFILEGIVRSLCVSLDIFVDKATEEEVVSPCSCFNFNIFVNQCLEKSWLSMCITDDFANVFLTLTTMPCKRGTFRLQLLFWFWINRSSSNIYNIYYAVNAVKVLYRNLRGPLTSMIIGNIPRRLRQFIISVRTGKGKSWFTIFVSYTCNVYIPLYIVKWILHENKKRVWYISR